MRMRRFLTLFPLILFFLSCQMREIDPNKTGFESILFPFTNSQSFFANGDFEDWNGSGFPRWDFSSIIDSAGPMDIIERTTNSHGGDYAALLTWSKSDYSAPYYFQSISISNGATINFSMYIRKVLGEPKAGVFIYCYDKDLKYISKIAPTTTVPDTNWQLYSTNLFVPPYTRFVCMGVRGSSTAVGTIAIDSATCVIDSYIASETLTNLGFEYGEIETLSNWVSGNFVGFGTNFNSFKRDINKRSGIFNARLEWSGDRADNPYFYQLTKIDSRATNVFSVYAKSDSGNPNISLKVRYFSAGMNELTNYKAPTAAPADWTMLSITSVAPQYAQYATYGVIGSMSDAYSGVVFLDDASFQITGYKPPIRFTNANYDFDGGIDSVLTAIGESTSTVTINTTITGIVTSSGIYMGSSAKECFTIQDRNRGIFFYNDAAIAAEPGDKVEIVVNSGKYYYGLPEVTGFGTVTVLGSDNPIYYQSGDYASSNAVGEVFMYEGSVETSPDSFVQGAFNTSAGWYYHPGSGVYIDGGDKGKFYGPVTISYDDYRLEICGKDFYSID